MGKPSAKTLPPALFEAACFVARGAAGAGARAWIVGGPVRDLVMGTTATDLDMASGLRPEEVERIFERTTAVGKAFGTVLVHSHGLDVQLTTFRRERGFSDARRPDLVEYSERLEEDARRRDFTCNAMYLDPLNDELRDPEGGLADIAARLLRAVGDPEARFAEDGLRLVRLARFAAALDFRVDPATLEGARASVRALSGVSAERRLHELERIFGHPRSAQALGLLAGAGLLEPLLPGLARLSPREEGATAALRRLEQVAREGPPGSALGLATLLLCAGEGDRTASEGLLDSLRPSRSLRAAVLNLWRLSAEVAREPAPSRSAAVFFARHGEAQDALKLAAARGAAPGNVEAWRARVSALEPGHLHPTLWLRAEDLQTAGIPRGPRWRELLLEAEMQQLEGRLGSREGALAWLAERSQRLS
jgi:tRNA nucleotidyltransferase/poly(A) polymerase